MRKSLLFSLGAVTAMGVSVAAYRYTRQKSSTVILKKNDPVDDCIDNGTVETFERPFLSDANQRTLGFSETVLQNRYVNAYGANNVGAILRVSGEIKIEKVRQILVDLMKKHPLLRAKLSDFSVLASLQVDENSPDFLPPLESSERKDEYSGKQYLEETIDDPFSQNFPWLWECRLFINKNPEGPHELVLKAHHVIMDGLSVASFMEEVLHGYNSEIIEISRMPFLKPTEDLITTNTTWTYFLLQEMYNTIWKACFGKSLSGALRQHACGATPFSDRRTKISFASFDHIDLKILLEACRHNGTTLTALITASLLLATREACGKPNIEVIGTPISTRANFDASVPPGDHLGMHIADTKVCFPVTSGMNIWDISKTWKSEMSKCLPIIYPAGFSSSYWKAVLIGNASLNDKPLFISGIGVSSLGRRNYMNQSEEKSNPGFLKFDNFYFCSSKRSGGKLMAIYTAQAGKKLELCFAHPDRLVTEEQAEMIKTNTLDRLKNIIEAYKKEFLDISTDEKQLRSSNGRRTYS